MKLRTWFLTCIILLAGTVPVHAQEVDKTPPIFSKPSPLEVRVDVSKDVGVAGNLFQDNLYALAYLKRQGRDYMDARVMVGRVLLEFSDHYLRYQGRIWEQNVPQSIEVIIKADEAKILGSVSRDYQIAILEPADQGRHPAQTPLTITWKFTGTPGPAEINVFEQGSLTHVYQLKDLKKNRAVIPAGVLAGGKGYLVQVRGGYIPGKFTRADVPLAPASRIVYSSSHGISIFIDPQKASKTEK